MVGCALASVAAGAASSLVFGVLLRKTTRIETSWTAAASAPMLASAAALLILDSRLYAFLSGAVVAAVMLLIFRKSIKRAASFAIELARTRWA
jgi:hypothetical protein